ncbi:MAG: hypothetical protein KDB21_11450 [Acidimicrobiales bacterium]|nr:hypothetical protein [Acidimicrobiales bacterium]
MRLIDPVVPPTVEPAGLAPRLAGLDGARIGLWSNKKLNADALLDLVAEELSARHDIAGYERGAYHPARVLDAHEWGRIDTCDAVILTHGD